MVGELLDEVHDVVEVGEDQLLQSLELRGLRWRFANIEESCS